MENDRPRIIHSGYIGPAAASKENAAESTANGIGKRIESEEEAHQHIANLRKTTSRRLWQLRRQYLHQAEQQQTRHLLLYPLRRQSCAQYIAANKTHSLDRSSGDMATMVCRVS